MIYVHVPFCRSFCTYCGFYSEICSGKGLQQVQNRVFEAYADAIIDEIAALSAAGEAVPLTASLCSAPPIASDGPLPLTLPRPRGDESKHFDACGPSSRALARRRARVLGTASPAANPQSLKGGTVFSPISPGETMPGKGILPVSGTVPVTASSPETLYFGGGTPSVLPVEMLERIVRALGPADYEEFTVEVNPDDIVEKGPEYVSRLRAMGVNRISMGVQSFDDGILRWMNRRHDAAEAREAFRILREAGVRNISIDLIFGLSQLNEDQWRGSIAGALALGPEHISAYQLSVEEGSALAKLVLKGEYTEASDEQCRRQYDILCKELAKAGYRHYEVSNWALSGYEAVHNSAYWRRVPYVGLGPGAHSFDAESGIRSWNSEELAHFDSDGRLCRWHSESETLTAAEAAEERIMLALRTASGLPYEELVQLVMLLGHSRETVDRLLEEGSLAMAGASVRIPEDRFFISDGIIARLI